MPFHNLRDTEIAYRAIRGERPEILVNAGEANISDGLRQLLIKCWNPNYTKRPQINEILQHLYQEPTLYSIFPPPDPPQVPSRESIFVSNTQQYGSSSCFRLASLRTYSSIADIFVTANMYPQTGGMFGATVWTTGLNTLPIRIPTIPHARESLRHL